MKKFINVLAVMLALVMCLGIVVACASDDNEGSGGTTTVAGTTGGKQTTAGTTTAKDTTTAEVTTNFRDTLIKVPTAAVPADGVIKSAAELHAVLVSGAADGNYTVQAEKLDMSGYTWTGMTNFSGTFDFNNCVIEGAIDSLFISVNGGTIKNLTLANANYHYTNEESQADADPEKGVAPNLCYSPVVRYATDITLENIVVESTVSVLVEIWQDGSSSGAILGRTNGTNVLIKNCHNKGDVKTDSLVVRHGGVVGIIECADGAMANVDAPEESNVLVTGCTNTGVVTNAATSGDSKNGGVVGYISNGAVVKCANYGNVSSFAGGQNAGVVGYIGGTAIIKDCLNTGAVTDGGSFTGGILGYSNGSTRYLINCVNIGSLVVKNQWGGIIGLTKGSEKVTNCYNLATEEGCATFIFANGTSAPVDPADVNTHSGLVITDCANLATVDAIFTAIDAVAPGVFAKTAEGSLTLVLG